MSGDKQPDWTEGESNMALTNRLKELEARVAAQESVSNHLISRIAELEKQQFAGPKKR